MSPNNQEERNSILAGETEVERNTLLAMVIETATEMTGTRLLDILRLADMIQNAQGCMNPAEQFIRDAVSEHYEHGGLTPEFLADQLDPDNQDGFAYNYRSQVELVARHQRMYPPKPAPAAE